MIGILVKWPTRCNCAG